MGEPTYTIELTKRAIEQLEKIKKTATKAAKERLERIFAELAYTPMNSSGFASPERLRNYPNEEVWRRVIVLFHFSVFYRILEEENEIEIVAFWDNRNDPKKLNL